MGANIFKGLSPETEELFKGEKDNLSHNINTIMPGILLIDGIKYLMIEEIYKDKKKKNKNIKIDLIYCFSEKQYWILKTSRTQSKNDKIELKNEANMMEKISQLNSSKFIKGYIKNVREENKEYEALLIERGFVSLHQILKSRINDKETYSEEELLYIFSNLIDSLYIMHQNKIYHIDIKPHNIILKKIEITKKYGYFFCDFGSVVTDSKNEILQYSPFYAPKEEDIYQLAYDKIDLFCLGVTMIELMVLKGDFKEQDDLIKYFKQNKYSLSENYKVLFPILEKMIEYKTNIKEINILIKDGKKIIPNEKNHKHNTNKNIKFSLDKNPLAHLTFLENIFDIDQYMLSKHLTKIYNHIKENEINKNFTTITAIKLRYLAWYNFSTFCFKTVSEIYDYNEKYKFINDPFVLNLMLIGKLLSKGGKNEIVKCTDHLYWYLEQCSEGKITRIGLVYFCLTSIFISCIDNEKSLKVVGLMNCYYRKFEAKIEENKQIDLFFFWFSICNFLAGKYESSIKYNVNSKQIEKLEGDLVFIFSHFMLKHYKKAYEIAEEYLEICKKYNRKFNLQCIYLILHFLNILSDSYDNRNYKELFKKSREFFENGHQFEKYKQKTQIYSKNKELFEAIEKIFDLDFSQIEKSILHDVIVEVFKLVLEEILQKGLNNGRNIDSIRDKIFNLIIKIIKKNPYETVKTIINLTKNYLSTDSIKTLCQDKIVNIISDKIIQNNIVEKIENFGKIFKLF